MFASSASHLLRQLTVDSRYLPFAVSRFVKVGMSAQCLSTSPAAADLTVQHDNEKCTFFIKLPEDHSQPGKHFFIIEGGGGMVCMYLFEKISVSKNWDKNLPFSTWGKQSVPRKKSVLDSKVKLKAVSRLV